MAVPETVAMESERRNHAARKRIICFSFRAILMVSNRLFQANAVYDITERNLDCEEFLVGREGPGRERSQREDGMVKANHHTPTRKRTSRSGRVEDMAFTFERLKSSIMDST
jgi:hypothetical protein